MSILYDHPATSANELRGRAEDLMSGEYHSRTEDRNNIEMALNILAHTMTQLADALDRIEQLEKRQ